MQSSGPAAHLPGNCDRSSGARGLTDALVFRRDGILVASVVQRDLIRLRSRWSLQKA
jgi:acyl-CoA thioesterase